MALHGEVKVNGCEIARWEAVRTAGDGTGECTYACRVDFRGEAVIGTIQHQYSAGALVLAAKVIGMWHGMDE